MMMASWTIGLLPAPGYARSFKGLGCRGFGVLGSGFWVLGVEFRV